MRGDPRKAVLVSLLIAGAAGLWVLAQWIAGDAMYAAIGDGVYPITFLAIFVAVSALAVAGLFRRYATVKADLLAGRNVVAQWIVDPEQLKTLGPAATARDRADKRGALYAILFFLALFFGGFALIDREAAPFMLGMAVVIAGIVTLAFWLGNRAYRRQWQMHSGEVIVGRDGLLFNGMLHVWSTMLSSKARAGFRKGPPPHLAIRYSFATRAGMQPVSVILPVPMDATDLARKVVAEFGRRR